MSIRQIYYADDDEDDISLFEEAVNELKDRDGANVDLFTFRSWHGLLEHIHANGPENSTIFLDINMPEKNGFSLLTEIRNHPTLNKIPVIIYSTCSDIGDILKSQYLGANLYAVKPHTFKDIIAIIKHVLRIDWTDFTTDEGSFYLKPGTI